MRNLERFRQSSTLSKNSTAPFPPKPSIMLRQSQESTTRSCTMNFSIWRNFRSFSDFEPPKGLFDNLETLERLEILEALKGSLDILEH